MKPNKGLVIRPDGNRATQVRAKLYTHGDSCKHLSSWCSTSLFMGWTEGAAAIGDDTLLTIMDLTENSTQAEITSIRVQYVVPRLCGKGQNGGPNERVP